LAEAVVWGRPNPGGLHLLERLLVRPAEREALSQPGGQAGLGRLLSLCST
jgi:hypothetical protein